MLRPVFLCTLLLLASSAVGAADGDLDPSFGGGIVRFDYRTIAESRCALLRQPDGALIVAGYGQDGVGPFLARLDADGRLDPAFGSGGVIPAGPGASPAGVDLALQPDGKMVLAVAHSETRAEAFVIRFAPAGGLDLEFGDQGIAWTGLSTPWGGSVAVAVSQGGQGNIYVAAHDSGDGVGVVRFNSSGALGPLFGGSGVARPVFQGDPDCGLDLALASGILLAGYDEYMGQNCVTRFAWDGTVDTTFGGESTGTVHTGVHVSPYMDVALDVMTDGRILLAGHDLYEDRDYVLRLDASGNPDPAFGLGGHAPATVGMEPTAGLAVVGLPDGGAALAGVRDGILRMTYLAVFDAGGVLDADYGYEGIVSLPIWRDIPADAALVAQPDGALVVAGADDSVERLFVARFVAPGIRDDSFGYTGIVRSDVRNHLYSGRSLAIQDNGLLLLAGYDQLADNVCVQRFDPTGLRDPDFGSHGYVLLSGIRPSLDSPIAIVTDPGSHRKYLATFDGNAGQHCVLCLDASGNLDPGFGSGGFVGMVHSGVAAVSTGPVDLALQTDGKVLLVLNSGLATGIHVIRFTPSGQLDATFAGGVVPLGWPTVVQGRVAIESGTDGSMYVAGLNMAMAENCITRLGDTGLVDPSFGTGGIANPLIGGTGAVGLVLDAGLLLAAIDVDIDEPYVARFGWDGALDLAFGDEGTGIARTGFSVLPGSPLALAGEPGGWIYLAGHHDSQNFIARFSPGGLLDPGFGMDGVATTGMGADAEGVIDVALQGDGRVVLATNIENPSGSTGDALARFRALPYGATAVPSPDIATVLALGPCFPNPFRQDTLVRFSLAADGVARAAVYDLQGRLVTTLFDGFRPAGSHLLRWSGRDRLGRPVASGIYFVRLESGGESWARKVVKARG